MAVLKVLSGTQTKGHVPKKHVFYNMVTVLLRTTWIAKEEETPHA
jgi:hypothetical protein